VITGMDNTFLWHKDENAVYEFDYECMKKSGKKLPAGKSFMEENLVQNYFELLLSLFFA